MGYDPFILGNQSLMKLVELEGLPGRELLLGREFNK